MLNDLELRKWAEWGGVTPYNPDCINPNSLDLRLLGQLRKPMWYWNSLTWPLFWKLHRKNKDRWPLWSQPFDFKSYLLKPGQFVLCSSLEYNVIPEDCTGLLFSKSSTGRIGLEHLHSGLGDSSWSGQWTWELVNVAPWPILLEEGKRIMQMVLIRLTDKPEVSYKVTGRYNGQRGPTVSRNY